MAKKTWKIGEYASGGVITVETNGKVVTVINKEWDTSTGYRKSSNQSNAQEIHRATGLACDPNTERKVSDFLHSITTSYYAGLILDWIKTKVKFEPSYW